MYLAALELVKQVEERMLAAAMAADLYEPRHYATLFRFLYVHLYGTLLTGSAQLKDDQVVELWQREFDLSALSKVHKAVSQARERFRESVGAVRRLHRNPEFQMIAEAEVSKDRAA
jgi:hypothetical protein